MSNKTRKEIRRKVLKDTNELCMNISRLAVEYNHDKVYLERRKLCIAYDLCVALYFALKAVDSKEAQEPLHVGIDLASVHQAIVGNPSYTGQNPTPDAAPENTT